MNDYPAPSDCVLRQLRAGLVIPAHPLALTENRRLDECRQRALTRYYHAAGAGGLAIGVHTTQFSIREKPGLLKAVLDLGAQTIQDCDGAAAKSTVRIAGICGETPSAVAEAEQARNAGYHLGLLSLGAMKQADDETLLRHCHMVAHEIPLFGFYLQPAVGGRVLTYEFWRRFLDIPNVAAIKIAPFNRYQTQEVVRAVAMSGRAEEIALYTGNDDAIVADLLTEYAVPTDLGTVRLRMVGGLLGHWACWTRTAVTLLEDCRATWKTGIVSSQLLTRAAQITDANAAFFDAANEFKGCIPGIHEVLRRQGLFANRFCLDETLDLSPGQSEEIDRVYRSYPDLNDDPFVQNNLSSWLA